MSRRIAALNCGRCGATFGVKACDAPKRRYCSRRCLAASQSDAAAATRAGRFWARVRKGSDCWVWTGSTDRNGYGRLTVPGSGAGGRRLAKAHRMAWELTNGPISGGLGVLHRCDNPPCVRPDHLWLGTPLDNALDMVSKGRQGRLSSDPARRNRVVGPPRQKISNDQLAEIRRRFGSGGVSQSALAREFGVHQSYVSPVVRGLLRPVREVA